MSSTGIFDVNYGLFTGIYTFLDDGRFYGLHFINGGTTLVGHPRGLLSASNSVTNMQPIAWANFVDDLGQLGTQEPAGTFGRTFDTTLSVKISGSMGTFSAVATQQKQYGDGSTKTLYGDPLPLSTIAGTYTGIMRTVGISTPQQAVSGLVIDGTGKLTVTAANCTFTGMLVQHGATGVFDIQAQTGGSSCGLVSPLKGIVTPLSVIGNQPKLGVQLDSADDKQTAVFIVTKS